MKSIRYIFLSLLSIPAVFVFGQTYFSMTYNMAFPLGNTSDFIPETSIRGFGVEAGGWVKDNLSVGLSFAWNGFYDAMEYDTYGPEDGLPSGLNVWTEAWKYTTVYPFLGNLKYYLKAPDHVNWYVGVGFGTSFISRVTDFAVYSLVDKNWHLTFAPEAGITYWVSDNVGFILSSRYSWSSKAGDMDPQSYMGFNLGLIVDSF